MSAPPPRLTPGDLVRGSGHDRITAVTPPREVLQKAFSLVQRAGQAWALDEAQIRTLLGDPDGVAVPTWFGHPAPVLTAPSLHRVGLVIALSRLLHRLDHRPSQDLAWLTSPHPRLQQQHRSTASSPASWSSVLAADVGLAASESRRRPSRLTPLERAFRQAL